MENQAKPKTGLKEYVFKEFERRQWLIVPAYTYPVWKESVKSFYSSAHKNSTDENH